MDLQIGLQRGPFSSTQLANLTTALSGLNSGQLQWLSGYITGVQQTDQQANAVGSPIISAVSKKLTILYGTHTGNTEQLAERLATMAKEKGIAVEVSDMATFKPRDLKKLSNLAVLVSTHGLGEPPMQAEDLYNFLKSKKAPDLSHLNYTVLALGDSSYIDFCQTGKDFDSYLKNLGAKQICARADCDVDFEEEAERWLNSLIEQLVDNQSTPTEQRITVSSNGELIQPGISYSRKTPFEATILEKINLNGKGSTKETYHIEMSLEGSGLQYEPGDALGVFGANPPALIDGVLSKLNFTGEESINGETGKKSLRELLTYDYELTPLSAPTLSKYAEFTGNSQLQNILSEKEKIHKYLRGRDILDLLKEIPAKLTAEELISLLKKNTPRMYSIASSMSAVEEEVHLLVSIVRYEAYGRCREGLCSANLADRLEVDDKVKVFIDKNSRFKLPTDNGTPIIMVGPGTGIAPFRSFIQERETRESNGKSWLFFGDRNFTTDFLYQTEWQQYLKKGILTKADVAFSRDQAEKHYVQHRMLENGRELYDWLENGAHLYVCGDAQQMAKDVNNTLKTIIQSHGGITPQKAEEYLKSLQISNRYQTDIY